MSSITHEIEILCAIKLTYTVQEVIIFYNLMVISTEYWELLN